MLRFKLFISIKNEKMTDFFYKGNGTLTPELDVKIVPKLEAWLKKSFMKKKDLKQHDGFRSS